MKGRIGDYAVKAKTGKDWKQWFSLLDKAGASKKSHKEIAEYLDGAGVPGWWAQMITVTYEQERGLRDVHQKADGYSASASRTFAVPLGVLYGYWADEKLRKKWLDEKIIVRKATEDKSMRITWPDGTSVEANFYAKGDKKSMVAVQQDKLAKAADVVRAKELWHGAFGRLETLLA
ncbi:MAG: hypothetical protein ABI348_00795 [Nitrososphaera sp.]|jgi:hypothetical protein